MGEIYLVRIMQAIFPITTNPEKIKDPQIKEMK